MVVTGAEVIGGEAREVGDVLGEQRVPVGDGRGEDVGIGASGESELAGGRGVDLGAAKPLGESCGVHLVEQQLQRRSAAVVSWRCSSMRAAISSG